METLMSICFDGLKKNKNQYMGHKEQCQVRKRPFPVLNFTMTISFRNIFS